MSYPFKFRSILYCGLRTHNHTHHKIMFLTRSDFSLCVACLFCLLTSMCGHVSLCRMLCTMALQPTSNKTTTSNMNYNQRLTNNNPSNMNQKTTSRT